MKYRKKPVIVEAVQFNENMILDKEPLPNGVIFCDKNVYRDYGKIYSYRYKIKTLEGDMDIEVGDWIITGVSGEHYTCKPDIFEMTYEKVEES